MTLLPIFSQSILTLVLKQQTIVERELATAWHDLDHMKPHASKIEKYEAEIKAYKTSLEALERQDEELPEGESLSDESAQEICRLRYGNIHQGSNHPSPNLNVM